MLSYSIQELSMAQKHMSRWENDEDLTWQQFHNWFDEFGEKASVSHFIRSQLDPSAALQTWRKKEKARNDNFNLAAINVYLFNI